MIPEHKYLRPKSLDETLALLNSSGDNSKIIAGGTDILPGFHIDSARFSSIQTLIDIRDLHDLKKIEYLNNDIYIGSAVTFSQLMKNEIIKNKLPLLCEASSTVGSTQIRNRASIGGNFINNAPCADSVPPLLVYNAKIQIQSIGKSYEIPLNELLIKQYSTKLKLNELVTKIIVPDVPKNILGKFYKLGRRRGVAISRISLAVLLKVDSQNKIEDLRIASGAVTPIGIRFTKIESDSVGKIAETKLFVDLAGKVGRQILDVTGLRWSSMYKLPVVQQKVYQLLEEIFEGARVKQ